MRRIVLVCASVAAAVMGCGGTDGADPAAQTTVVAAFYPLAYAAEQVAGGSAEVANVTPSGAEPHDVELSARDVERIRDADAVVFLGGGFQPAVEEAVEDAAGELLDVLTVVRPLGAGEDGRDPHVWLDPLRYAEIAGAVAELLERPGGAEILARRLEALDADFREGLARCERRELVTSHAAFAYLADRYGLRQVPITGLSPEAEPTPRELERVVATVRDVEATTVFVETLVSPRLAETVAREAGIRTAELDPVEGLTSEQEASGADYFSLMRANLAALREGLGCR